MKKSISRDSNRATSIGPVNVRWKLWALVLPILIAVPGRSAVISVEGSCSLVDAVHAANNDDDAGGLCPPGGAGADTLVLTGDVALSEVVDTTDGANGLPSITSDVTIAGGGFQIERVVDFRPEFRVVHVGATGRLVLRDTTISGGLWFDDSGGGVFNRGTLVLDTSTVSDNRGGPEGGGVYNLGGVLTSIESSVEYNYAIRGGGIANREARATIVGGEISSNYSYAEGGGIFNYAAVVEITEATLSRNETPDAGGGVANVAASRVALTNTTIDGNSVVQLGIGGGVYNRDSYLLVDGSELSDNDAIYGDGGGLFNASGGVAYVRGGQVFANYAYFGGGISNRGELTLVETTISANTASDGSYGSGGGIDNNATLHVERCLLADNEASERGGGLRNEVGTLTLVNSTVSGNEASISGGGLHNGFNGTLVASHVTVVGNSASVGGGAYNAASMTLANTLVADSPAALNCAGDAAVDAGGNFDDDGSCGGGFGTLSPVDDVDIDHDLLANGGPTETHALPASSVAVDAVANCGLAFDQRIRRRGLLCDSGAFEHDARLPVVVTGDCPGTVSVQLAGATPDGTVFAAGAAAPGTFFVPAGNCLGTELGLDRPTLLARPLADPSGRLTLELDLPAAACGRLLQLVDESTCGVSAVAAIPE